MKTTVHHHLIPILQERGLNGLSDIQFMDKKATYRQYSYSRLWFDLIQMGAILSEKQVNANDTVAVILPTQEDFLSSFFACQFIHAIPFAYAPPTALTDPSGWSTGIETILTDLDCKAIVTDDKTAKILAKFLKTTRFQIINVDQIQSGLSKNKSAQEINTVVHQQFNASEYLESEIAFLQLSSGTTGLPKAVMISQKNVITNCRVIADALPGDKKDIALSSWLPLYHDMGLVGCLLMSIVNGTRVQLLSSLDFLVNPYLWLKGMSDFRATITTAPNFAYGLVTKRVSKTEIAALDLSCLKGTLCGAENVSARTAASFIEHLKPSGFPPESFLPVYGLAEASLAVSFTRPQANLQVLKLNSDLLEKGIIQQDPNGIEVCSVGHLLPTFELKITDATGKALQQGNVGHIQIKGPSVTNGYFKNAKLNDELLQDGWLKTGDEGFVLDDQLYICGRIKDIIIVNGKNHYPVLYEEKLSVFPEIRKGKALVSSVRLPEFDSDQVIVLAESASHSISAQNKMAIENEIAKLIKKSGLPVYKAELLPPGTLKKTSSGKIQRRLNIQLWKDGRLAKPVKKYGLSNLSSLLNFLTGRTQNDQRTNI